MRISASMYSLASTIKKKDWSVVDFVDYAASINLEGVELLDIYWEDKANPSMEIEQVKKALDQYNMVISAYDITNNFVEESEAKREKEVTKVIEAIYTAKQLGANIVRVFCGDLQDGLTFDTGQAWIIECLKQCAKTAEQESIYLALENHGLLAGKSEQVEEIINKVNSFYVKSTFDTGNFLLVHEDPKHAFDRLKDKIVHVHFKDFRVKETTESIKGFRSTKGKELIGVIPGDGMVDLSYIVNGLKEINYQGWLSMEYEGKDDAKTANEEAVNRLKELVN